uniref:AIMP2 thioredoxin-like domain-containing protein n=1 Tax=Clastoptera arizonana TaxID=38151 RepID=A0A1B6DMX2_9HEMI
MSVPCMYNLKPVIPALDSCISSSMYSMKNIHGSYVSNTKCGSGYVEKQLNVLEQVPLVEVEHLEQRQEAILKQLTALKDQMAAFRIELNQQVSVTKIKTDLCSLPSKKLNKWTGQIRDVVVNASPTCPPYSLLAIKKLWCDVLDVQISCYVHSTVATAPTPHLSHFQSKSESKEPNLPKLNVSLIWKNVGPDCEVVISPINQLALRGEVNLLRYLHHTLYPATDILTETKVDYLLDACHRLIFAKTMKEKQSLIKTINATLGKQVWLGGNEVGIMDVAAWSAIKNVEKIELTQNMQKWMNRCKESFEICS